MINGKFKEYFKKLVETNSNINEICNTLHISINDLSILLEELRVFGDNYGFYDNKLILKQRPKIRNNKFIIDSTKDHIRLLLLGDVHLANKESSLDELKEIYDIAESTNTDYALNCGDTLEGLSLKYNDFKDYIIIDTYEGQKDLAINEYPSFSGKTLMVSGNHDDWWYSFTNKEILNDVANKRSDIIYLGANAAEIEIGELKINILHGDLIPSTNEFFSLKNYINSLDEYPDIIHLGHKHAFDYQIQECIECFRTPSFMNVPVGYIGDRTNEKGAYFIDIYMDDNGNVDKIKKHKKIYR